MVLAINANDCEWYTPKYILDHVIDCFPDHTINCDPAWSPESNVQSEYHYSALENGLDKPWYGNIFLNPPYGNQIKVWAKKFRDEWYAGNVKRGILLVPAKMETEWFRSLLYISECVDFFTHRIVFDHASNKKNTTVGTFSSALLYIGQFNTLPRLPDCYRMKVLEYPTLVDGVKNDS